MGEAHRPDQQKSAVSDHGQGLRLHTATTQTHRTLGAAALSPGPAETPTERNYRWPPARPASQPAGSSYPGPRLPPRLPVLPLAGPPSSWQGALACQTATGSRGPQPPIYAFALLRVDKLPSVRDRQCSTTTVGRSSLSPLQHLDEVLSCGGLSRDTLDLISMLAGVNPCR